MGPWCRRVVVALCVLYAVALVLFVVGTFGPFGSPSGPLAGVFLIPLGLPWVLSLDAAPGSIRPALAALAPLVNIGIAIVLCRIAAKRSGRP